MENEREQDVNPDVDEAKCSVPTFQDELSSLLNSHNREIGSDTPDFILAQFLTRVLGDFNLAVNNRHHWWNDGKLNPAAAVFGVLAWLSTRDEEVKIGAANECSILAELAEKFCEVNHLGKPNDMSFVVHPK